MAILGLNKLNRKLKEIPKAAVEAARESVETGAIQIAALQRSLAPYDDGDLHASIVVTGPGETTPPYSIAGGGQRKARENQALITAGNTKVRYAHIVEFGSAPHINGGMFAGTQHPGTTPQPFFWPGYRAMRRSARSRVTRTITKKIREAANKGGRNP